MERFGHETWLTFPVIIGRLLLAALLGALVGAEREWRNRPAGLRTHILICVATATIAILSIEITHVGDFAGQEIRIDPLRLTEATTAGVAFLAAGLIFFSRGQVHGLTTGGRHVAGWRHRVGDRAGLLADRRAGNAARNCGAGASQHIYA